MTPGIPNILHLRGHLGKRLKRRFERFRSLLRQPNGLRSQVVRGGDLLHETFGDGDIDYRALAKALAAAEQEGRLIHTSTVLFLLRQVASAAAALTTVVQLQA